MHKTLEEYLLSNNLNYTKSEKKWFNSNAYFPLIIFEVKQEYNNYKIRHQFEFKESEFTKPNFINSSDSLTSRISIKSIINIENPNIENFEIKNSNYFKKIFNKDVTFKISTNNKILENKLLENSSIKSFFKMFINDPEFEPIISGKKENNNFCVNINFMCRNLNENYLALFENLK